MLINIGYILGVFLWIKNINIHSYIRIFYIQYTSYILNIRSIYILFSLIKSKINKKSSLLLLLLFNNVFLDSYIEDDNVMVL